MVWSGVEEVIRKQHSFKTPWKAIVDILSIENECFHTLNWTLFLAPIWLPFWIVFGLLRLVLLPTWWFLHIVFAFLYLDPYLDPYFDPNMDPVWAGPYGPGHMFTWYGISASACIDLGGDSTGAPA